MAKKKPIIWYKGAPEPLLIFCSGNVFPTIPKLIVGSTVKVYVNNAIPNVSQPIIVFHLLKLNAALSMYLNLI
jgi:hypothetical protein